jgi:hypothetical protein
MTPDRITKLPKWAQAHIHELEQRAFKAECDAEAIQVMHNGAPRIKPNVHPPDTFQTIVNGWRAYRPHGYNRINPIVEKACTSSIYHSIGQWDKTTSQNPISIYSSPSLALRSLLPEIVQAYRDEIAATLKLIKEHEEQ